MIYIIIAFIAVCAGIFELIFGFTVYIDSAIHQVYQQLIYLTGVILIIGGFILCAASEKKIVIENKNKDVPIKEEPTLGETDNPKKDIIDKIIESMD